MLHRIHLPVCVPELRQILQFQRDVLAMACSEQISLPLTEKMLVDALNDDERGSWLWGKLWKQRGPRDKTKFHLALIKVIEHVDQHPHMAGKILESFDSDIMFHNSLDDPDFHFRYNALNEETRTVLKPFMRSFYEDLLTSGFEAEIHGGTEELDRDAFIASFWEANSELEVCPACDRQRSDKVDEKIYDDADHFLPKSKYPFLSLHYENLIPLCIYCNRSFKHARDSIDDHDDAPLVNIFHPYERPALEHLDIFVNREFNGVTNIKIEDKDGTPSRRVENLKRVFRLHERWPDRLRYRIGVIRDQIAEAGHQIRKYGNEPQLTEEDFQELLEEMRMQKEEKLGRRIDCVLQVSYLTFVLQDHDEFDELFRYFVD